MKRLSLCVLALHLAVLPCLADVIPSRRTEKNPAAEQTLKARLEQVGLSAADAQRHVQDLTPGELAYFAENPDRVQAAGGLYWYEWVIGATILTGIVIFWVSFPVRLR